MSFDNTRPDQVAAPTISLTTGAVGILDTFITLFTERRHPNDENTCVNDFVLRQRRGEVHRHEILKKTRYYATCKTVLNQCNMAQLHYINPKKYIHTLITQTLTVLAPLKAQLRHAFRPTATIAALLACNEGALRVAARACNSRYGFDVPRYIEAVQMVVEAVLPIKSAAVRDLLEQTVDRLDAVKAQFDFES